MAISVNKAGVLEPLGPGFPTLGYPGDLGLLFPETPANRVGDEGFIELLSNNTWVAQGWDLLPWGMKNSLQNRGKLSRN